MAQISMYATSWCNYCTMARELLKSLSVEWTETDIDNAGISRKQLYELTGGSTVPQIVINGQTVGGYRELSMLHRSGALEKLLSG